jgi:CRISPR type III-B/RAMP module RAMP protein Cmr6
MGAGNDAETFGFAGARKAGGETSVMRLLHDQHRDTIRHVLKDCEHPGLLLHRFLNGVKPPDADAKGRAEYDVLWHDYARGANKFLANGTFKPLMEQIEKRQRSLIAALRERPGAAIRSYKAATSRRLAVGLSHGRLWSISFQLHPLYGIPYVPATSIKGAMFHRAWMQTDKYPDDKLYRLFGEEKARGSLVFLDAHAASAPAKGFFLEDVVNKHYEDYFEGKEIKPPADYCAPKPVKLLTIRPDVVFYFRIAANSQADLTDGAELLKEVLLRGGLGAKTRRGYGRFKQITDDTIA